MAVSEILVSKTSERGSEIYNARLEESNQELEHFAVIASHDLQAPLRKIKLFSEMLCKNVSADDLEIAIRLKGAVAKMEHFISDLFELSRVSKTGKPFRQVSLRGVIQGTIEDLEPFIHEASVTIRLEVDGLVYGNKTQLEKVFLNLLSNSIKFKKIDTPLVIDICGLWISKEFFQITVTDNGIGFQEEYCEKIFRPFERLHGANQFAGTGMGLAICQKIISRHGGQITAKSKETLGSEFSIRLSLNQKDESSAFCLGQRVLLT